jgi:hypothetical protein
MSLKHIRLELARHPDFPDGSHDRGYEFIAPLDDDGHLVAAEWRQQRSRCRVKRFWHGEPNQMGMLVHKRGGAWAFDYDPEREDDDESGFKLSSHRFVPGEYVSFRDDEGELHTFRVTAVGEFE